MSQERRQPDKWQALSATILSGVIVSSVLIGSVFGYSAYQNAGGAAGGSHAILQGFGTWMVASVIAWLLMGMIARAAIESS